MSESLHKDALALTLYEIGAVALGEFTLHSGKVAPIYIDLRLLASYPAALRQAARAYQTVLADLQFDLLTTAPLAGLPIGTAVSLLMDIPMVYPRKTPKAYGMGKLVEGKYEAGQTAVTIDDITTSGDSILQTIKAVESVGLKVTDAVLLIDRQQGGLEAIRAAGYNAYGVITLQEILEVLEKNGRITPAQHQHVLDNL
jgi:uridine monophosphate synthetase